MAYRVVGARDTDVLRIGLKLDNQYEYSIVRNIFVRECMSTELGAVSRCPAAVIPEPQYCEKP